ncbi:MAG TPA: carbohydrate binding domain-containing protein [Chthoniobacteraceae bacterium]|nr:carbohydrate binding domain-containing protein [Chthoniobacteraceae bacterium]
MQTNNHRAFIPRNLPTAGPTGSHISIRGAARLLAALGVLALVPLRAQELFPFALPWDDASENATNVSSWLDAPAGKSGFVEVKDGHLFAGEKRLRFFGVNMAFGGNFPTHADAEKIAARMAKFGINCVRFHHMDMQSTPGGIWAKDMQKLDPERLDRLDYFIAQLKRRGIYTDLNLHVSRTYPDRPKAEKTGNPNYDAGVDNFSAPMIKLQKEFARALLTHVNPYTGAAYIDEPAVALIEINNENALLFSWNNGQLDKAAAPYRAELGERWLKWLRTKYGSDSSLAKAWGEGLKPAGPELLKNGTFQGELKPWAVEQHAGAAATGRAVEGTLVVDVMKPGSESWHVQFSQSGLEISEAETYAVTFRARSDSPRAISVNLGQTSGSYKVLASQMVALTPEWQELRVLLKPSSSETKARLGFTGLGAAVGKCEFSAISLRTAALDASLPQTAFTKADYAGRTAAAQRDWFEFLWHLEEKYWPEMYGFIRDELKARSLIVGTQLGWSPFPIQSRMDVIDSHAYWQHPHFPGRPWDMNDWRVKNDAMAGAGDGGTLPDLALQRVAGKPYICTEYNHAAPNTFSSETFPLICAYAALQDWDGIFAFAYSHRADDWAKGYFPSFFDIDQHPTKMATLPASLALFLRGDVAPAKTSRIATVTLGDVIAKARAGGPRIGADHFGVPRMAALMQRVGIKLGTETTTPPGPLPTPPKFASDRDELVWDTLDKVVTIDTSRSKAVIGFAERRSYELSGMKIEFGALRQGFGSVQVTTLDGTGFTEAKRMLITATADVENTGMKWTSPAKESVGRNWGTAPSLVEGVPATVTFPGGRKLTAWALDERGQRRAEVALKDRTLAIGPEHRTLWYEVLAE